MMQFGGIIPSSSIDYPDKISIVVFTPGCNFKCPFCQNYELVNYKTEISSEDQILSILKSRSKLIEGLVISGGEPTIQKDILDFLKKVRDLGLSIKLDTNGYNPEMLLKLLNSNLVDYIAMDIKQDPLNDEKYSQAAGIKIDTTKILESIALLKQSNIDYQFRTTLIKEFHTDVDIYNISTIIIGAKLYVLQAFRPITTLDPEWSKYHSYTKQEMQDLAETIKNNVQKLEILD